MRKPDFAYAKTKALISCSVTARLISAFVFTARIVQLLFYLNPKFQASNYFQRLERPVCARPGRKPQRPVSLRRGSYVDLYNSRLVKQISLRKMFSFFCMIKVTDYQIQGAYNVICMKLLEIHVM